jgi:rod shape-determining protein MreC
VRAFWNYTKKYGLRLLIVVLLAALLSGLSIRSGGASAARDVSQAISEPAKIAATGVVGWLEGIYAYMYRFDEIAAENEALTARVTELENELRGAKEAMVENEHYRELLGLRSNYSDFVFEDAKVVDRGVSNWNTTLTLDRGQESGIEIGDCVVDSSYNLVGQVIETGNGWSVVRSVIDTDMSVGVLVGEGGTAAMIVGDFALMREGLTKLTYLASDAQIFVNDIILTSGRGGAFPQNLVIGTVTAVHSEAGGQIEFATVEPAADPDELTLVFVIKEFEVVG